MPRLYISMRPLPHPDYPARVIRSDTATLEVIDPRASKQELLLKLYDLLEPWEHAEGCRAYGQPPPNQQMSEEMVTGACLPFVPRSVRVPGEPAIQNPDLHTRAGQLAFLDAVEWAALERQMSLEPLSRGGVA